MTNRAFLRYWWPRITDVDTAKDAAQTAAHASFFLAAVTLIAVLLTIFHLQNLIDSSALVAVAIYAVLGILIRRMSRLAAISAFVLFFSDRAYQASVTGLSAALGFLGSLLLVGFFSGVRGTLAYHRFKSHSAAEAGARNDTLLSNG